MLFSGRDETTVRLLLALVKRNGLYYCFLPHHAALDSEVVGESRCNPDPNPTCDRDLDTTPLLVNTVSHPVTARDHLTSELWAARLGYCGTQQLSIIPGNVTGIPPISGAILSDLLMSRKMRPLKRNHLVRPHPLRLKMDPCS